MTETASATPLLPMTYSDTNLLIALCLGEEVDNKAVMVQELYNGFKSKNQIIYIPPSVIQEFDKVIGQIYDWIMNGLRELGAEAAKKDDVQITDHAAYMATMESLFIKLREIHTRNDQWRILEWLEHSLVLGSEAIVQKDPDPASNKTTLRQLIRHATMELQRLYTHFELRIKSSNDVFKLDRTFCAPDGAVTEELKGFGLDREDSGHLSFCIARSRMESDQPMIFFSFDNRLLGTKSKIRSVYSSVDLCHPIYAMHRLGMFPVTRLPRHKSRKPSKK